MPDALYRDTEHPAGVHVGAPSVFEGDGARRNGGFGVPERTISVRGRLWALGLIAPCLSGSPGDQMRLSAPASRGHLGRAAEESLRTRRLGMGLDIA
jgi:hypothetical protein